MAADLATLTTDGAGGRPLPLVLTTGGAEANRKLVEEHGIRCPVLLQEGMEIASRYQCNGTPMATSLMSRATSPASWRSGRRPFWHWWMRRRPSTTSGHAPAALGGKRPVEESKIERNGLPAGTPAPGFRLPLLYGGELSLEEYRGRKVLLVFSDPNCGPCDQLAPPLERQSRASGDVQVLMLSRGELEANRAKAAQHGLTFPILLQRQWEISRDYAMFATPVAYLIDEEGIIAREVAVGVEPILALLAPPPVVPSNGKGRVARPGKEPARRR